MRPLAAMDIPAGQTATPGPGGMHIMLLGLTRPLREGESFPLTLSFEHAGPRQVTVAIEKSGRHGSRGTSNRLAGNAYASLSATAMSTSRKLR
jgi:copper(I)-binding protein